MGINKDGRHYDFSGWASRYNIKCGDGRTIRNGAMANCDGRIVPLVYNHSHDNISDVLGHALLEERPGEGVYCYGFLNDTEEGKHAKTAVENGDIRSLSIYANKLQQNGHDVVHGNICEVSLVLAGANPGAYIDSAIAHGDLDDDSAVIFNDEDEGLALYHDNLDDADEDSDDVEDDGTDEDEGETEYEDDEEDDEEDDTDDDSESEDDEDGDEEDLSDVDFDAVLDQLDALDAELDALDNADDGELAHSGIEVYDAILNQLNVVESELSGGVLSHADDNDTVLLNTEEFNRVMSKLSAKDQYVIYGMLGLAYKSNSEGGSEDMKHSVFEYDGNGNLDEGAVLSHSDEEMIIANSKRSNVGSLQTAIAMFEEENGAVLAHSFDPSSIGYLYDEFKTIPSGAPDTVTRNQEWVSDVLSGVNKVPNTRLRTRHVDARTMAYAKGYVTGTEKQKQAALAVTKRETTPQTVYVKDELNKDDIDDITDFDSVNYHYNLLRADLNETLAMAILVGDLREDSDPQKIEETHIRPIWKDDPLYVIRGEIDMAAAKAAVQGTGTSVNFGDNFVFSEAMIEKCLELRRGYHGVGNLTFYCPTTVLNTMLLAKDRNGRRIYNNATDLASALNVKKIVPIEQFENLTRTVTVSGVEKTKKLIGIMVNLSDYEMGAVKNGQIAKFDDFDIDYNKYKTLLETRCSGTLTKLFSAIVLEEDVTAAAPQG